MKPWLLNILACPIDKHHPLEAYIFRWSDLEEVKSLASGSKTVSSLTEGNRILEKQFKTGVISPPALKVIHDLSGSSTAEKLLRDAIETLKDAEPKTFDALHKYLNMVDVAEGLLVCSECGRWFPVGCAVESIPELMPDELREREPELTWLEKWGDKIPTKVLETGLPFRP